MVNKNNNNINNDSKSNIDNTNKETGKQNGSF